MLTLEGIRELCRTPSGFEIKFESGKYVLEPETYKIMAQRANLCVELLDCVDILKKALIKERFWAMWRCGGTNSVEQTTDLVEKQLSKELPDHEIF